TRDMSIVMIPHPRIDSLFPTRRSSDLVAETGMSPETALLGTTPGAIETMTAVALDVARQPALVLAMQIFRMVGAVLVGPPVVKALARPAAPPRGPVGESPLPRPPLGQ